MIRHLTYDERDTVCTWLRVRGWTIVNKGIGPAMAHPNGNLSALHTLEEACLIQIATKKG